VAKQIPLNLPHVEAMTREDFLVTDANRAAMAMIEQWPTWPSHGAIVCGPAGSGKSHLAAIWQTMSGANSAIATSLTRENVPEILSKSSVVVEDIHDGGMDEAALFHLLNLVRQTKSHVMLTSRAPIQDMAISLSDLRSRLSSLPTVTIAPPDDALINYLLARMPRSLGMARDLVARIDAEALTEKAEITRAFAGRVLAQMTSPDLP
jgi:chromosomal replication initiation ATPase DnaA